MRKAGSIGLAALFVLVTVLAGSWLGDERLATRLEVRNLPPSWSYWFGTDWLGRDVFVRTVKGLATSVRIGLIGAAISAGVALLLGLAAATLGRWVDRVVTWLIDLFLGLPHLIAIILIAVAFGGGAKGIIIGVAATHWTSLARVIRAEVMQLRAAPYVELSRRFGRSSWWIATRHMLPHLLPQLTVGGILMFPHVILHEAAITFLGFGLSPHQPAIGIILNESMDYLASGYWWLAFFPGLCLLLLVRCFDVIGTNLRSFIDPHEARE